MFLTLLLNGIVIKEIDVAARKGIQKLMEYLKSDEYDAVYFREKKKAISGDKQE